MFHVPDFRFEGACVTAPLDLHFPIGTTGPAIAQAERAKQDYCFGCPVRQKCLQWALDKGEDHGVWGGMTEAERRALKRREQQQEQKPALDLIQVVEVQAEHQVEEVAA